MNVLVAGASGLIGRAAAAELEAQGHSVVRLVRRTPAPNEFLWDPATGRLPEKAIASADAVVNLCGAGIAQKRWSAARKRELRSSRIEPTRALVRALCEARSQGRPAPGILLNASAIGFYGNQGNREVSEASAAGQGYLADLCRDWEDEALAACTAGVRVVCLRFGIVLSREGGFLRQVVSLYRAGLGLQLGDGRQWVSWIELEDAIGALMLALHEPRMNGPLNVVAPTSVMNAALTRALGRIFGRQLPMAVPGFVLRWRFGQMADEMLLSSVNAVPSKLMEQGYPYHYANLEDALYQALAVERLDP